MNSRNITWKKGFRKIPPSILSKITTIVTDSVCVECVKVIKKMDVLSGKYKHLGFEFDDSVLHGQYGIVPDPSNGFASKYNTRTKVIIHKDQEKEQRHYSFEAPNFGDWSKGTHEVERTVWAYPRTILTPLFNSIIIEILEKSDIELKVKFSIDRLISKEDEFFERELLRDLNLLQENVGAVDVFSSATSYDEYLRTSQLDWEIFPVGTREDTIAIIRRKYRNISSNEERIINDRFDILKEFANELITGSGGMQRYFGAKIRDDLVVFENVRYGNALYILQEDWRELTQLSRIELMQKYNNRIIRITHSKNWKAQLRYQLGKLIMQH